MWVPLARELRVERTPLGMWTGVALASNKSASPFCSRRSERKRVCHSKQLEQTLFCEVQSEIFLGLTISKRLEQDRLYFVCRTAENFSWYIKQLTYRIPR